MTEQDEILTLQEAAKVLKVSESTLRRWMAAGTIKGYKMERQWRFMRSELVGWLKGEK